MNALKIMESLAENIQAKDWAKIEAVITEADDYNYLETILSVLLRDGNFPNVPSELIEKALEKFCAIHSRWNHDSWIHSLSHFTHRLWDRELFSWISRLNELAFGKTDEGWGRGYHDNCCGRLIMDVARYGSWATNPAELALTSDRIAAAVSECTPSTIAWVQSLPFASEKDAEVWKARWCLDDPLKRCREILERGPSFFSVDFFRRQVRILSEAGHDVTGYERLLRRILQNEPEKEETGLRNSRYYNQERIDYWTMELGKRE